MSPETRVAKISERGGIRNWNISPLRRACGVPEPPSSTRSLPFPDSGVRILVREWPTPPEVPNRGVALLLHGLGDHSGRHAWAAGLLTGIGMRVLALDWPGCGGSEGVRGDLVSVEHCGRLLDDLLEILDLSPSAIFAHSTGGYLLLRWLERCGRDSPRLAGLRWVWLSSPLLKPSHRQPKLKISLAAALSRRFPLKTLSTGVTARDCFHSRSPHASESERLRAGVHHRVSLRFAASLIAEESALFPGLSGIREDLGFLLTQGIEDRVCPPEFAEELLRRLPARRKHAIFAAGGRHEPYREPEAESFSLAVKAWLDATVS